MGLFEKISEACKRKGITVNALEKELGFARSSINKMKKSSPSGEKLAQIADYLGVSVDYLLERTENDSDGLNARDRRDIAKDLDDIMGKLESGDEGPLRYNGEQIDNETLIKVRAALEFGLTQLKKENKVLYNHNKNKKQD